MIFLLGRATRILVIVIFRRDAIDFSQVENHSDLIDFHDYLYSIRYNYKSL